jgi:hypothetical protein
MVGPPELEVFALALGRDLQRFAPDDPAMLLDHAV